MNTQFGANERIWTRLLTVFLLLVLAGLQYALWQGDKNVHDLRSLEAAVENTREENVQQEQTNQRMMAEILDLKQGGETVETLARYNLGLIKPQEIFYQIIE